MKKKKSSISGIDSNIIVLASYLGGLALSWLPTTKYFAWLLPLIIYILERNSEFVKKHAAQACSLYAIYSIFAIAFTIICFILFPNTNIFNINLSNFAGSLLLLSMVNMIFVSVLIIVTIFCIIAVSKTWHYEEYDIPFVKKIVKSLRKFVDKLMANNIEITEEKVILEEDSIDVDTITKNETKKKVEK